jgi:hypothetical protein
MAVEQNRKVKTKVKTGHLYETGKLIACSSERAVFSHRSHLFYENSGSFLRVCSGKSENLRDSGRRAERRDAVERLDPKDTRAAARPHRPLAADAHQKAAA